MFCVAFGLKQDSDRKIAQNLIANVTSAILDFKDRQMYDNFSMNLLKAGVFHVIVEKIIQSNLQENEFPQVARVFELCACHSDGIKVLRGHLPEVMALVQTFMTGHDLNCVRYPAATVLLDLTANEECIEQVGLMMREGSLF